jgi:hypothetical protein
MYEAQGADWGIGDPLPEQGKTFYKRVDISALKGALTNKYGHNLTHFSSPFITPDSKVLYLHVITQNHHRPQIERKYDARTRTLTLVIDARNVPLTPYSADRIKIPLQGVKKVTAEIAGLEEFVKASN